MHKGSCLCRKITFEVVGELQPPTACHCTMCRKHHGHFEAGTGVLRKNLKFFGEKYITWYHSSEKVRRGFCSVCGSSLFFDPLDHQKHNWIGISMGAFDGPTGVKLEKHIYVADKGDYYEIADGLPQNPQ